MLPQDSPIDLSVHSGRAVNPDTESCGLLPLCNGDVPDYILFVFMEITLYLSAEKISRRELNRPTLLPFAFNVWSYTVVHNVTA